MDLRTYIKDDLYNELRWLLSAAAEWQAAETGSDKRVIVYAMDSAFLHARSLYEFFTWIEPQRPTRRAQTRVYWRTYGLQGRLVSRLYTDWIGILHDYVMHLNDVRGSSSNVLNGQQLNKQILIFAEDVLHLWDQFSAMPEVSQFSTELADARRKSVEQANSIAKERGLQPLFT